MKIRNTILLTLAISMPQAFAGQEDTPPASKAMADLKPGEVFKDCPYCPEMVVIPAGSFDMGSNDGNADERPVHNVNIGKVFALGKAEVTQVLWKFIMDDNPSRFKNCGNTCPVENVSWDEVQKFIKALNAKTGVQFRLPAEAEWEYACRAGGTHTYCGSDNLDEIGWHEDNSDNKTHPACQKQVNAFGLCDMSGNVWEWVEDSYNKNYNGAPTDGSAWWGFRGMRVLRGGSWSDKAKRSRASSRLMSEQLFRNRFDGFRLARTLP